MCRAHGVENVRRLPGQPWLSVNDFSMRNKCCKILSFPVSSHLCWARNRHHVHSSGGRRRRTTGTRHIWVIVMLLFPLRRVKIPLWATEEGRRGAGKAGYTCFSVCKKSRVVIWRETRDIGGHRLLLSYPSVPVAGSVCAVLPTST